MADPDDNNSKGTVDDLVDENGGQGNEAKEDSQETQEQYDDDDDAGNVVAKGNDGEENANDGSKAPNDDDDAVDDQLLVKDDEENDDGKDPQEETSTQKKETDEPESAVAAKGNDEENANDRSKATASDDADAVDDQLPVNDDEENDDGKDSPEETSTQEKETDVSESHAVAAKGNDEGDSEKSSSDGSDSSSDDDDSSSEEDEPQKVVIGEDGHALSAYEIQRLERIRRNKEYLASLGLEKNKEAIAAAKAKKKAAAPARKKQPDIKRRSSISRASKEKVLTYSERKDKQDEKGESKKPAEPWQRKKENRTARMERFIHDEFRRLSKERKSHLKRAQTNIRKADVELRIAEKRMQRYEKKRRKQIEYQSSINSLQKEQRSLGGFTARRMLQELDARSDEIQNALQSFDEQFGDEGNLAEWAKKQEEKRKKMEIIDAMDRFPRTLKDSVRDLDFSLIERSPRDPPPPRRGTRKRKSLDSTDAEEQEASNAKMRAVESSDGSKRRLVADGTWGSLASAITAETLSSSERAHLENPSPSAVTEESDSKPAAKGRPRKKKREVIPKNVGGWVSPAFAQDIDRSWLEADEPPKKFDLVSYIPQVGDTVLYYPAGHRMFLEVNPDILGRKTRNITRVTLWDRAKKEKEKMQKAAADEKAGKGESQESESKASTWWNEDWLSRIDGDLDRYPILCRVEKTHAEFPPDPSSDTKVVSNDKSGGVQVTWKAKKGGQKKEANPLLRLAVMLRPLTPVLPPQDSADDNSTTGDSLTLPPNFYVVTFPSKASPFLVPFSLAYRLAHSLSDGSAIRITTTKPAWRGNVTGFKQLGGDLKPFSSRFDDKMGSIRELCDALNSGRKNFAASLEASLSMDGKAAIPLTDACVVVECFEAALKANAADTTEPRQQASGVPSMMHLIRSTLPLWNEVAVANGGGRERTASAWELTVTEAKALEPAGPLLSISADIEPESGLVYMIDEPLRTKLECTIEDFLKDTPDAGLFYPLVSDEEAPSYSCAVPRGMAFSKVLRRLKSGKTPGQTRCYYRIVDSLLGDITAIADNCFLYNSPDSLVSLKADEIIPTIKRLIASVASQHFREKEAIEKLTEERRQAIMMQYNAPALQDDKNEGNELSLSRGRAKQELQQPYTEFLHRSWIQDTEPDKSWSVAGESTDVESNCIGVVGSGQWVPQSGDNILYSRSLHTDFVKGHYPSLTTEQCILPRFSGESENAASDAVQNRWLVGTIVWVRAAFPRAPSKRDPDYENTFEVASPVLDLGIRFNYNWASNNIYKVSWRPCTFTKEQDVDAMAIQSKGSKQGADNAETDDTAETTKMPARCKCDACRLDIDASFVRPAWIPLGNQVSTGGEGVDASPYLLPDGPSSDGNLFANPSGIPNELSASIDRCLNVLKRRCLDGVPANQVNPRLSTKNVKDGFVPPAAKIGRLPAFDRLLTKLESTETETSTRGVEKVDKRAVALLTNANYLPQWTSSLSVGKGKKTNRDGIAQSRALHETLSPNPNFCLELIQVRLRNGYYRDLSGLVYDIQEAYVASVLLLLTKPASAKGGQAVSIRRIAKALAAKKDAVSFAKTNNKTISKKAMVVPSNADEKEGSKNSGLSDTEEKWVEKLYQIRKLYATALVCVLQPKSMERIFGVVPQKKKPKASAKKKPDAIDAEREQRFMKARNTLGFIYEAVLIQDPLGNRPISATWDPSVKVRVRFTGQKAPPKNAKTSSKENSKNDVDSETTDVDTTKPIVFECSDYEHNKDLVALFFGKPGRMKRCGRCRAYGRSIMSCRVRRKHSLPDFDWVSVFQGTGGLNGLLHTLRTGEPPPEVTIADSVPSQTQPAVTSAQTASETVASSIQTTSERLESTATTAGDTGASEPNPVELLEKAKEAVALADQVMAKAEKFSKAPVRLSEQFVSSYFPIDTEDNHYNYCILCGLIGDVICCEGCPNVVHPKCVNLEDAPDEDWYCSKCRRNGKAGDGKNEGDISSESQKSSAVAAACDGADVLPATMDAPDGLDDDADRLEAMLGELKSVRPIRPKKPKKKEGSASGPRAGDDSENEEVEEDEDEDNRSSPASKRRRSSRAVNRSNSAVDEDDDDDSSDEDLDHDVRPPPERIRVGMHVKKKFGKRYFKGTILECPSTENAFYLVRYEDDDEEDLEEHELREKCIFINPKRNRSKSKRGAGKARDANEGGVGDEEDEDEPIKTGRRSTRLRTSLRSAGAVVPASSKKRGHSRPVSSQASEDEADSRRPKKRARATKDSPPQK